MHVNTAPGGERVRTRVASQSMVQVLPTVTPAYDNDGTLVQAHNDLNQRIHTQASHANWHKVGLSHSHTIALGGVAAVRVDLLDNVLT